MSALNFAAYDLDWLPDFGPCPGEAGPGDADAGAAHPWQVPHALPPASWAPAQAGGMMVGYPAPYAAGQPRAAPLPAHAGAARATLAAAAPARAVPPPPPPRAALAAVTPTPGGKCLDPGHCSPCSRDTAMWSLVGDPGRKNGEKKLKQLLLRTPEWLSPERCAELAACCDRDGLPALASVLRRQATSAALRKADFIYASCAWGYSSDIWQPRNPPKAEAVRRRALTRARVEGGEAEGEEEAEGGGDDGEQFWPEDGGELGPAWKAARTGL